MADENATTDISYCPHLRVYHYHRADGTEYFFSHQMLEDSIDAYLKNKDAKMADFMAILSTYARKYPHTRITFTVDGKAKLSALKISPDEVESKIIDDCPEPTPE